MKLRICIPEWLYMLGLDEWHLIRYSISSGAWHLVFVWVYIFVLLFCFTYIFVLLDFPFASKSLWTWLISNKTKAMYSIPVCMEYDLLVTSAEYVPTSCRPVKGVNLLVPVLYWSAGHSTVGLVLSVKQYNFF